jgi:hypothetical protein
VTQAEQFPADLHAPPGWVLEIEGRNVGKARWQDGSYGNDAAPSWILIDDAGTVHAQAFYYTSENAERFEKAFGAAPYVAVSIIRDEEIVENCVLEPGVFLSALAASERATGSSPVDAFTSGLRGAGAVLRDGDGRPLSPA